MTAPHSIYGVTDLPKIEVVPGVPYAEKSVASSTPFEQDRLRGPTPVLSDGSCLSERFVTRLAVTFRDLQCRSCKGSCPGPSSSSTAPARNHPDHLDGAQDYALHCPTIISSGGVVACTYHHAFTPLSQHRHYCQLQHLVGARSNFCSLDLDLISCSWLCCWRLPCCQGLKGVHILCRCGWCRWNAHESQTGE